MRIFPFGRAASRDLQDHLAWLTTRHVREFKAKSLKLLWGKTGLTKIGDTLVILGVGSDQVELWISDAIKAYDAARKSGISPKNLRKTMLEALEVYRASFDGELKNFASWDFEDPIAAKARSDAWQGHRLELVGRMADLSRATPVPLTQRYPAAWALVLMVVGAVVAEVAKLLAAIPWRG